MDISSIAVSSLFVLALAAGLAGTLLPILPGLPFMWLVALAHGWLTDWRDYGFTALLVTGILVVFSLVLDQLASVLGAKKFGASRAGLIGSVVGGLAGLIFFSLIGLILGVFLGALLAEMAFSRRDFRGALAAGTGALLGFLAGSLFKFMIGLGLMLFFLFRLIA